MESPRDLEMSGTDGEKSIRNPPLEASTSSDETLEELKPTKSIAESLPLFHEILFVGIITLAQFTTQACLAATLILLHVIGDDFGVKDNSLSWLVAGYSLTVGTFILISGRLGDLYGYKRMLIIGFVWFSLTSILAGLSVYSGDVMFIFSRVLQGIGPAITLPNGLALLGATYAPGPRKDMVFSIFGASAPCGAIVGAGFAGLFSLAWWPWAFWSLAIILAIVTVLSIFIIPEPPKKIETSFKSFRETVKALDLLGATTGITALILFNFAWNQAPIVGWKQPYVYVCLIISTLFMALFFYIEIRVASSPLIPFEALTLDVGFVLGCITCGWAAFGIWYFYIINFFQVLRGTSPLLTAAYISPVLVSGMAACISTGLLLSRLRPGWLMVMALASFTIGPILIATCPVEQTYWAQIFVCLIIMPWGMDMSFPAGTIILSNAVKKEHQGIAASLINTIVNYSISLGLGFAGTVEVHVNKGGHNPKDILRGYRGAWYTSIGIASLGLGISICYLARGYYKDYRLARRSQSKR